jgi:WD40 repeat protein
MIHLIAVLVLSVPHLDQHGDPLPPGAVARFGTIRFRVGSKRVRYSHALSPDGKHLAVENSDGIDLWDTESGRVAKHLPWRTSQGDFPKFGLAFSPDGNRLARLAGRVVAVWDLATGKELFDIDLYERGKGQGIAWVPGKNELRVTSEDHPRMWVLDGRTGKVIRTTEIAEKCSVLQPVGKWVLGLTGSAWILLDPEAGKERARFPTAIGAQEELFVLTPDGKEAWHLNAAGTLMRYQPSSAKELEELEVPPARNTVGDQATLAVAPDGSVVYVSNGDRTVYRRDVKAGRWLEPVSDVPAGDLLPHPDGKQLLIIRKDGVLRRYNLATLKELPGADGFEEGVFAEPSPDGKRVAIVSGKRVSRLDVFDTAGRGAWSDAPFGFGCTPCWSPDGRRLAVIEPGEVRLRDSAVGKLGHLLRLPEDLRRFDGPAYFTPGGDHLIATADRGETILAFNPATGELTKTWEPKESGATDLSPDGRRILYQDDNKGLRLFDLTTGRFATDWFDQPPEDGRVPAVAPGFSPDGSYLLTWELEPQREAWRPRDSVAILRDPRTGNQWKTLALGLGGGFQWAFSPDGLWLAVGGRRATIELFELATGERLGRWEGHKDSVSSIRFAGPGRVLTASGDLTALLWDVRPPVRRADATWEALSGADAKTAWRAVWALAADPKAPDLLRAQVAVPSPPAADKVKQWLTDLGADRYAAREAASRGLKDLGRLVEPDLRAAREQTKSEEVRSRLDALLASIRTDRSSGELIQARAVAALEAAGTPAARKVLAEWADGPPGARLTVDARAALKRMNAGR